MSKFFSKTSWKPCGLLPVIDVMPLVLIFQPSFSCTYKLALDRTVKQMPSAHSSVYFNSDEGQFCCIRTIACSLKCDSSLLIRTIPNKASLQLNPPAGPGPLCSTLLLVLGKHTSMRHYQRCQVVFTPGFLQVYVCSTCWNKVMSHGIKTSLCLERHTFFK